MACTGTIILSEVINSTLKAVVECLLLTSMICMTSYFRVVEENMDRLTENEVRVFHTNFKMNFGSIKPYSILLQTIEVANIRSYKLDRKYFFMNQRRGIK